MPNRILFLTLNVFSVTGGIEKVCRVAGKALADACDETGGSFQLLSAYDDSNDVQERYFPAYHFKGFRGDKLRFGAASLLAARASNVVLLSHINLLPIGYAIKRLSPSTKIVLLAHGIEVWRPLASWKLVMLQACDLVLPVSQFTRQKMLELYGLQPQKLRVVNNCLDPFLPEPCTTVGANLQQRYGLQPHHQVIMTLSRLSGKEKYKGYDDVIASVGLLKNSLPHLRYLVVGRYDNEEEGRIRQLAAAAGVADRVILTGFIAQESLAEHFALAQLYVMPSRKEGFGIVFIEAMYYGLPVIAGNVDGSVDALDGGRLGMLINPSDKESLTAAIRTAIQSKMAPPLRAAVEEKFGFAPYKMALTEALQSMATQPARRKKAVYPVAQSYQQTTTH